ncbi:hypothetical protein [Spirosoma sp. 48-14]|mgnify:CR=1 FL=1|uniref:hypothetical protein n=1 Tax=Spirosoma sp. 48-14 TaxID=1895854 RepID=UPI00095CC8EB|nr:hypothetical protein [Spirosoma sp. 48-14]OJW76335.1 MAG: hypothetical protein BGO59_22715 [Spirosoma sp. 48-14]
MKQLKSNNKYLEKVRDELTVYQQHLLDGTELNPSQWDTWDKIDSARAWLKQGHTDSQVLAMLKNSRSIQERRAREILALAYAVFAELRQGREKEGVKYLYAEMFREAAKKALDVDDFYNYSLLLKEAAKIDGAYDNQKVVDTETYKKPSKVVFKVKQLTVNNGPSSGDVENTNYEISG